MPKKQELKPQENPHKRLRDTLRHFMGYVECGEGTTLKFWQDDATKSFHAYRGDHEITWSDKGFDDLLEQMGFIMDDENEETNARNGQFDK